MAQESGKDFSVIRRGRLTPGEWSRINALFSQSLKTDCDKDFGGFDQDKLESLLAVGWRHKLMKKGFTIEQAEGLIGLRRRIDAGDLQRSQFRI